MTSTRLPKKVLLPLCDKTILEVIFDRLSSWKNSIIVATTNDGTETPIVDVCRRNGIKYFRGDNENVLDRYYQSAMEFGAKKDDVIVRVTSDSPLIDPRIIADTIEFYKAGSFDYVSNRINRRVPIGLDVEVFSFRILEEMNSCATEFFEKEHVTPYVYSRETIYSIGSYEPEIDGSIYRMTLDEKDDYTAIIEIYAKFQNRTDFNYEELISMMENNPRLYEINSHIQQKTLKQ